MNSVRALSVVVLVPMLAAAAACGGSTKKVDPAADLALAKTAVLTSADLPGYTGAPHKPDDDIPVKVKQDFATCMKTSTTIFDDTPGAQKANSPDFSKGEASISNEVEIDPKKSDINTGYSQISQQGSEPCLKQLFEAAIEQGASSTPGVTFTSTDVTRFDPGIGDKSVGYTVKITAEAAGTSAVFYADLVFVARDRAGITVTFFDVGTPTDRALETSLVQKVYDRIGTNAK